MRAEVGTSQVRCGMVVRACYTQHYSRHLQLHDPEESTHVEKRGNNSRAPQDEHIVRESQRCYRVHLHREGAVSLAGFLGNGHIAALVYSGRDGISGSIGSNEICPVVLKSDTR